MGGEAVGVGVEHYGRGRGEARHEEFAGGSGYLDECGGDSERAADQPGAFGWVDFFLCVLFLHVARLFSPCSCSFHEDEDVEADARVAESYPKAYAMIAEKSKL